FDTDYSTGEKDLKEKKIKVKHKQSKEGAGVKKGSKRKGANVEEKEPKEQKVPFYLSPEAAMTATRITTAATTTSITAATTTSTIAATTRTTAVTATDIPAKQQQAQQQKSNKNTNTRMPELPRLPEIPKIQTAKLIAIDEEKDSQ
ncbi:6689_t:CDS:2, partial [Cetraspora pellucida]